MSTSEPPDAARRGATLRAGRRHASSAGEIARAREPDARAAPGRRAGRRGADAGAALAPPHPRAPSALAVGRRAAPRRRSTAPPAPGRRCSSRRSPSAPPPKESDLRNVPAPRRALGLRRRSLPGSRRAPSPTGDAPYPLGAPAAGGRRASRRFRRGAVAPASRRGRARLPALPGCPLARRAARAGLALPAAPSAAPVGAPRAARSSVRRARPDAGAASPPGIFDPHAVKRDFPILRRARARQAAVWLDNAATTQKPQAVIDRLSYFYEHENSNIHRAAHTLAARATDAYEGGAREGARAS